MLQPSDSLFLSGSLFDLVVKYLRVIKKRRDEYRISVHHWAKALNITTVLGRKSSGKKTCNLLGESELSGRKSEMALHTLAFYARVCEINSFFISW